MIDTALAIAGGYASYVAHSKLEDAEAEGDGLNKEFLRFQQNWALVGAVFEAGAAVYGFVRTARCESAQDAFDRAAGAPPP